MILFDSHAHMHFEHFDKDRDEAFNRAREAGVGYIMNVGSDLEASVAAINLSKEYDFCYATVGCHPHDTKNMDEETLIMFKGLAKKPKVQAIGEIGLDYYHNHSDREVQQYWFRKQIQLALELNMPIIIHDRDAHEDVMRILKEEQAFNTKVEMHCFSGSKELAMQYVRLGTMISIAGPVTFKNARKLIEVVEAVPLEYLLIETDAPYLTPEPNRGKRNESAYVKFTAKRVAIIKGISLEEVAEATTENAKKFFNIE